MRNTLLLFSFSLFLFSSAYSQTYKKQIGQQGSQFASWIEALPNQTHAITGNFETINNDKVGFFIITDNEGFINYQNGFKNSQGTLHFTKVKKVENGFAIVGYSYFNGSRQALLLKTNIKGNLLWSKYFNSSNGSRGTDVIETSDGGLAFLAYTGNTSPVDLCVLKLDANGNKLWGKTYSRPIKQNWGWKIEEDAAGDLYFSGSSYIDNAYDGSFAKINGSNGNLIFVRTYGKGHDDGFHGMLKTKDGNFLLIGNTWSYDSPSEHDPFIVKVNPSGTVLWKKRLKENGVSERTFSASETNENQYIISASTFFFEGEGASLYLLDNNTGNLITQKHLNTNQNGSDYLMSVDVTANGKIVAVGAVEDNDQSHNLSLIQYNSLSDGLCSEFSKPVESVDIPLDINTVTYNSINNASLLNANLEHRNINFRTGLICNGTTSLSESDYLKQTIEINPNPSTGKFSIDALNSTGNSILLSIYSEQGILVYEEKISNTKNFYNLEEQLNSGIYWLYFSNEKGQIIHLESHVITAE